GPAGGVGRELTGKPLPHTQKPGDAGLFFDIFVNNGVYFPGALAPAPAPAPRIRAAQHPTTITGAPDHDTGSPHTPQDAWRRHRRPGPDGGGPEPRRLADSTPPRPIEGRGHHADAAAPRPGDARRARTARRPRRRIRPHRPATRHPQGLLDRL